jgi:hypothetical protein
MMMMMMMMMEYNTQRQDWESAAQKKGEKNNAWAVH